MSCKKQKCIYLSEEELSLLKSIKKEQGIKSDSQVVAWLLRKSALDQKELAIVIRKELEENYLPKERIRWGVQTAEQNSIVLLDAMNTLLHMLNAKDCISTEVAAHPVIAQSQDSIKRKVAYFKQKSDERKSKLGLEKTGGHK